jgi:hypothetical protein
VRDGRRVLQPNSQNGIPGHIKSHSPPSTLATIPAPPHTQTSPLQTKNEPQASLPSFTHLTHFRLVPSACTITPAVKSIESPLLKEAMKKVMPNLCFGPNGDTKTTCRVDHSPLPLGVPGVGPPKASLFQITSMIANRGFSGRNLQL